MTMTLASTFTLGQSGSDAAGVLAGGFFGLFFLVWCGGILIVLAHFVLFITVAVKVITSREMPTENRVIWGVVAWFLPLIGSILFWTVGVKDKRPMFGKRTE